MERVARTRLESELFLLLKRQIKREVTERERGREQEKQKKNDYFLISLYYYYY